MEALLARRKDDRGFTLIELMVVVLIIGILLSIAIPSFFGARRSAQDVKAKATLRNALTAAKVYYAEHDGKYDGFEATGVAADYEPALPWADITIAGAGFTGSPLNSFISFTIPSESGRTCKLEDLNTSVTLECVAP